MSRSAICLVIDRLPAHLVGAYGNTWIHTPALDALAAESLLCEFAMIDSPRLELLYRGYWQGTHAACPAEPTGGAVGSMDLASLLRGAGVRSLLMTDEPDVASLPCAQRFDDLVELPHGNDAVTAESVEATGLGRFFAAAVDAIGSLPSPGLLWLHSRGLSGPWDAPYELRSQYAADEDPPPTRTSEVPNRLLAADHDPDERLGIAQACAGQVTAADVCLGALLDALEESPRKQDTLLIVLGARGFPLGEHLRVGACDEALYEELVHVPLLVRLPGEGRPLRSTGLVQPADLLHTLLDWWDCPVPSSIAASALQARSLLRTIRGDGVEPRDRAVAVGPDGQWAVRTRAWYLLRSMTRGEEGRELFAKPDDRWEVNDVTRRCGDVVAELAAAGAEFLQAAASGSPDLPAPLSDVLLRGPG